MTLNDNNFTNFTAQNILQLLPPREKNAYKNQFGHVLIIGGDNGMPGAVRLAAESALRTGAGLVSVVTRPEHITTITATRPEIMCYGITDTIQLNNLLQTKKIDTIIVGPGLGRSTWSQELFACAMQKEYHHIPLLLDADALHFLSHYELTRENWVLTPHPGEAANLLQSDSDSIQANRLGAIGMLGLQYGGVIVLKGSGTLILDKNHTPSLCKKGNPGMASGGMGDLLSGIIGALMAQSLPLFTAAQLGVFIHAACGDLAAQKLGERGLLASDLLNFIQPLVNPSHPSTNAQYY